MTEQVAMIDVSANNHLGTEDIDWHRVYGGGYRAAMVKCSEGIDYVNPWRVIDAKGATGAEIQVGYYHFAHPGTNTAEAEAAHALSAVAGLPIDLGLALDLEVQEGRDWSELAAWAKVFHAEIRKTLNHSPLYVNDNYLANLPGAPWGERLWLAQTIRPRREVWAWQMTQATVVRGIAVPTDVGWLHPDK